MARAKRPVFVPLEGFPFVREILIEFEWFPGFAVSQAQKSIASLHRRAAQYGITPVLEISSKSKDRLGVSLSAFNLRLSIERGKKISVESAFQGSKVFEEGGPYTDLYYAPSRAAKTDPRIKNSGNIVAFRYFGREFPTEPKEAFYNWLYITALYQNQELSLRLLEYKGFTDIAFNPEKSVNCQARAAALFVAFYNSGVIKEVVGDQDVYLAYIKDTRKASYPPSPQLGFKFDIDNSETPHKVTTYGSPKLGARSERAPRRRRSSKKR